MKKTTSSRRIAKQIKQDLEKKMVLLSGPRQCGKTTLAQNLTTEAKAAYYNWDILEDKQKIKKLELDRSKSLWIFDEIHKYKTWRNWLKGVYDQYKDSKSILVTGSAKLDVYRRGGDSLQGRYFLHRLHPLTLSELLNTNYDFDADINPDAFSYSKSAQTSLETLLELSGFPEPFFGQSRTEYNRWQLGYQERLVREEIVSLERVIELDKIELLMERLPDLVGSPLSINSVREDLEVNHKTISNWLSIFERTFASFRISPFGSTKIKAVKKEQKLYLWDWASIEDKAARFENLVAVHLLRFVHYVHDVYGQKLELRYFRDVRRREVDFIVLKKNKPWFMIECKSSEKSLSPHIKYLAERVKIPYAFQIHLGKSDRRLEDMNGCQTYIMPAAKFLQALP